MRQTKLESLIEAALNVLSGFLISLIFWSLVIVPIFYLEVTTKDNILITSLFTLISVIRSYLWRRFFNNQLHKLIHKYIKRICQLPMKI